MIEKEVFIPDDSFKKILKQVRRNMDINSRYFGEWLREYVISTSNDSKKGDKIED